MIAFYSEPMLLRFKTVPMLFTFFPDALSILSWNKYSIGPNIESPGKGSNSKSIGSDKRSAGEDFSTANIKSIGLVSNSKSIAENTIRLSLPMLAGGRCKGSGYNKNAASIYHDREVAPPGISLNILGQHDYNDVMNVTE